MSVINRALSDLASKQENQELYLHKAEIPTVPRSKPWLWVIVGFSLSLGLGSWAVSLQDPQVSTASVKNLATENLAVENPLISASSSPQSPSISPTSNVEYAQVTLFESSSKLNAIESDIHQPVTQSKKQDLQRKEQQSRESQPIETHLTTTEQGMELSTPEPKVTTTTAKISSSPKSVSSKNGSMVVSQIEMTPQQLSDKAVIEAQKALDDNDLNGALENYSAALRYTPTNEMVRQRLAALYYGKKDPRRAFELLEAGIKQNVDSETLRLSLAKMLIKEKQNEAALTPLVHLPPSPSVDYLSMRAGLAQQIKQTDIALESYQLLIDTDNGNARWWLGLGIQRERSMEPLKAKYAYQQALNRVGISSQTKQFIQQRLDVLNGLEESSSATN